MTNLEQNPPAGFIAWIAINIAKRVSLTEVWNNP